MFLSALEQIDDASWLAGQHYDGDSTFKRSYVELERQVPGEG